MKSSKILSVFAIVGLFFFASCGDNCYECSHVTLESFTLCEDDADSKAEFDAAIVDAEATLDYDCKKK